MTKKSMRRMNRIDYGNDEGNDVNKFITISLIIIGLLGLFYGITELVNHLKNKGEKVTVNYNILSVGNMLSAPYDEYYVMLYSEEDEEASSYAEIKTSYEGKGNHDKIYFVDLNKFLNKDYYDKNKDGKSNNKAKSVKDFDFVGCTLLRVTKGEITSYIEGYDNIYKELLK